MKLIVCQSTVLQLPWLYCQRENPHPRRIFFKVSEENVVTGSQVRIVGRMVKLYEATFPYGKPEMCVIVCGCIVTKQQDTNRQLSTTFVFDILAFPPLWKHTVGVSNNGRFVWHEFRKQNTSRVAKNCYDLSGWLLHTKFLGSRGPLVFPLHGSCVVSGSWWLTHVSSPVIRDGFFFWF